MSTMALAWWYPLRNHNRELIGLRELVAQSWELLTSILFTTEPFSWTTLSRVPICS